MEEEKKHAFDFFSTYFSEVISYYNYITIPVIIILITIANRERGTFFYTTINFCKIYCDAHLIN